MPPLDADDEEAQIQIAIRKSLEQKPSLPSDAAAAAADAASAPSLEPGAEPVPQDSNAGQAVPNIVVTYNITLQVPNPWPPLDAFTQQSSSSAVEASSEGTAASGAALWDLRVQRACKA